MQIYVCQIISRYEVPSMWKWGECGCAGKLGVTFSWSENILARKHIWSRYRISSRLPACIWQENEYFTAITGTKSTEDLPADAVYRRLALSSLRRTDDMIIGELGLRGKEFLNASNITVSRCLPPEQPMSSSLASGHLRWAPVLLRRVSSTLSVQNKGALSVFLHSFRHCAAVTCSCHGELAP
jgi:hypothetical protein